MNKKLSDFLAKHDFTGAKASFGGVDLGTITEFKMTLKMFPLPEPVIRITGCKQGDCVMHSDGVIFDRSGILYAIWNCAVCGENYCAPAGAMSVHISAHDWRN